MLLENTLRMLLTSFEERITAAAMAVPTLVLAGKADTLLGPDTQRAIACTLHQQQGHRVRLRARISD